jgi:hypothetical protein
MGMGLHARSPAFAVAVNLAFTPQPPHRDFALSRLVQLLALEPRAAQFAFKKSEALAACVVGALSYDIAYWFQGW